MLTSWRRLYALLRRELPDETYHPGRSLEVVEQDTEGVTARFSGGSKEWPTSWSPPTVSAPRYAHNFCQ